MPKLPAVAPERFARVARKLGFVLDRQKGSHAIFLRASDKRRLVLPMHRKELKRGTLHSLIADLGITPEEFTRLL